MATFKKYLSFSFDDGLEQDRKLIELLKKYGLSATFNLNAGLFGKRDYVGRIGSIGFTEYTEPGDHGLIKTAEHFRLQKEKIAETYSGFEIASHTYTHTPMPKLKSEQFADEIDRDIRELSEIAGYPVRGFAYPGGVATKASAAYLGTKGLLYARTAFANGKYNFPADPMRYAPTAAIKDKKAEKLLDAFLAEEPKEDLLFCLWGHGYEADFGTANASYAAFERIFAKAAGHSNVIYCTLAQAFEDHNERA